MLQLHVLCWILIVSVAIVKVIPKERHQYREYQTPKTRGGENIRIQIGYDRTISIEYRIKH